MKNNETNYEQEERMIRLASFLAHVRMRLQFAHPLDYKVVRPLIEEEFEKIKQLVEERGEKHGN